MYNMEVCWNVVIRYANEVVFSAIVLQTSLPVRFWQHHTMKKRENFLVEDCLECDGYGVDFWDEFFCRKGKNPEKCRHLIKNKNVQHKDSNHNES